jgi:hypothetical protein
MLPHLSRVSTSKFMPSRWIVAEPFPQLRRRSDLFHPLINLRFGLFHTSRPQPIDKDPSAVRAARRPISPFYPDIVSLDSSTHFVRSGTWDGIAFLGHFHASG